MACITKGSSSSSHTMSFDVFVSFRGTDTRNNFTDHIFASLQRKGVVAFRDNHNINKGQLLEPEIFQAIKASRLFIVVFSKNYASSSWCLKELTMIADLVKETGQSVLPIFYDVTPSEVRKQSGEFHKAFARYEESFRDHLEMVQKWREAMKDIANRAGWDVMNKQEHEAIEKIVEEVINLLDNNQIWSFGDDLVDMHSRVKLLEEFLNLGANEVVRVIGICGMGGIGKTTVATALFDKISSQYHACCFIDDVSKIYREFGPIGAQKKLLCQALNQGNTEINNLYHGTKLVRTRLCHLKVLIVLDNVDQDEQLENLALNPKYLGAGSRIVIISRDTHILRNYGVNDVYNVPLLNPNKALQLFCRKAFKSDNILNDYGVLTNKVLRYVNGLPLGVKVLGSFLFDRDISEWRSALTRMKENPSKNIMDVLRISFDGLEEIEKEIFLDIACFFSRGYSKWEVKKFLDHRGFYSNIGMEVLIEKSLISCKDWEIKMHDLLSELGKSIVREKSPQEPINWSRLWDLKDLENVMIKNEEAKNVEAIVIKFQETTMTVNVLSKMKHLKMLILDELNFEGNLSYLSNELRYLSWNKYPSMCLPSNFHPDNLVELILHCSNVKQLWKGTKNLPNLRYLDLSYSESLIEMPDLTGVPRLRDLNLEGCIKIMRIHPSIGILRELHSLNLRNCKNLFLNLNIIFGLNSLRSVNLSGCTKLLKNGLLTKPREAEHLENVDQNRSAIQLSISSVYQILTLPLYLLSSRKHEDSLHLLLPYLSRLRDLDLSFCNLFKIPDSIGSLQSLFSLNLEGNKFARLPTTIKDLSSLSRLNLNNCKQLTYLPELPTINEKSSTPYLRELYVFNCPNLSEMVHNYRMVFSWMIQLFEVMTPSFLSFAYFFYVYNN
ncbi:hypothetical protein Fmac_021434 [Flemingia macrophylla]|uniref:TIR domain-containing protein n=1 Tax=Flemingia macrophylla TaxID=520843 RepID=A0ABD1LX23_9FABA